MHKAPLPQFLSGNPFPHPLTQGFFYREKMRAVYRIAPDRSLHWRFPCYRFMKPICPEESEVMADWGYVRRGYTIEQLQSLIALPCQSTATFINPITIVGHDIAFSRLSRYARQSLCTLVSPIVWVRHWLHRPESKGTETASAWQKS